MICLKIWWWPKSVSLSVFVRSCISLYCTVARHQYGTLKNSLKKSLVHLKCRGRVHWISWDRLLSCRNLHFITYPFINDIFTHYLTIKHLICSNGSSINDVTALEGEGLIFILKRRGRKLSRTVWRHLLTTPMIIELITLKLQFVIVNEYKL